MKYRSSTPKRILALFLVLSVLAGYWVPNKVVAADNLLADSSIDTAMTPLAGDGTTLSRGYWTSVSWASMLAEPVNAHTGDNLAHLVYASNPNLPGGQFPCMYQDVDVQPNSIYRLTFWAKTWNVGAAAQPLYYGYRNPLGTDVWAPVEQYSVSDLTGEYRQITLEFDTRELTTIRVFAFTTSVADGFGGHQLDDFSLEFVRADNEEETGGLLTDGSFNNAMTVMTDGNQLSKGVWTSMSWASANKEYANARSNAGLAHLVCASDALPAGEFPTIYQDVDVQPNSIYRLTFYAKQWNFGAVTDPLYYGYRDPLGTDVWAPVEQYEVSDLGNTYRQITLEFNTKELTTIRIFAFTKSVSGGYGGYHLDDFRLECVRADNTEESGGLLIDGSFNNTTTVMTDGNQLSKGVWTSMSWASANKEYANARSGSGLAHLICAADGVAAGEFPTIYQDVEVEANSIYRLTFYAKQWNFGAVTNPLYYGYRNALTDVWTPVEQLSISGLSNEYTQITMEFKTGSLTCVRIFAFTQTVSGGAAGYHLDDFKLEKIGEDNAEATGGLLQDGSFNSAMTVMTDGTLSSLGTWTSMSWASAVRESANAYAGSGLANLVYAADGLPAGEYPTIYQDVQVQKNSIYRLTFYAKGWNIGAQQQPLYYGYRNGAADVWTPVEQCSVSDLADGYQKITLEFDTKELTTVRIFAFTTSVEGGAGGYHLDNFSLEYVEAAEVEPEETDDPNNLLVNGSFIRDMTAMTDGTLSSIGKWTAMSWAATVYEKENAWIGSSLANLVISANGLPAGEYPTIYQDVEVEPYSLYTVTFYAKHWSVDGAKAPLYYGYRNGLENVWVPIKQFETETVGEEYQKITFTFNTGNLTTVRIFAFTTSVVSGGISGYHLDGFTMQYDGAFSNEKYIPVSKDVEKDNLVYDSSFEKGDSQIIPQNPQAFADVWTLMSVAGVDGAYQYAYSGASNLFMAYAAEGMRAGDYPTVWQDVKVEKNTWYEMSFYVKQWGVDAKDDLLYYGFRDPNAGDIWINAQEFTMDRFSQNYARVTCRFNTGDRDVIRLFFCIVALDFQSVGGAGGYHIDDVQLHKLSDVTGADFSVSGSIVAGEKITYKATADFANGNSGVSISGSDSTAITFESKDEAVVTSDLQGNLIAAGLGTTEVRMIVKVNDSVAYSEWKSITVSSDNGEKYISKVNVSADGSLTSGQYVPLTYQILRSDGQEIAAGACTITVQSSDPDVIWVKRRNDGYVLYGVGQGTAVICVTAEAEDKIAVGKIEITIEDGNYLLDSSFEMQSQATPHWKITGSAPYGVDDSTTNKLSRTGDANLWMAAPVSWSDSVLPGSCLEVSQDISLEAGSYTLSAFINRFYATGTEGILSELGGLVELGIVKLSDDEPMEDTAQQTQFDVTYGVGAYQQLDNYITVTEAGQYRVYIRVTGDDQFGLGMQLEDVTLRATAYPDFVSVELSQELKADGMAQLVVTAHYADGSELVLEDGFTAEVSDTSVAKLAGRNLLGVAPGKTQVTVTAQIAGKTYTAQCEVTVTGEAAQDPNAMPPAEPETDTVWYVYVLIAVCAAAVGVIVFFFIKKKKTDDSERGDKS